MGNNITVSSGATFNVTNNQYTSRIQIQDDIYIEFSDGFTVSGKELKLYMKMLKKLAVVEYPEEFI